MVSVIWRVVRVGLATAAGAFLASVMANPAMILVTPIISGAFKALRDKFKNLWWLPL
jgi:hypothetical protein